MSKKELSVFENAMNNASVMPSMLEQRIIEHAGGTSIATKTNSEGKEFISATFKLANPTSTRSEVTVMDEALAVSLEQVKRLMSMEDVSRIALAKKVSSFADTDATSLGFDNTVEMLRAIFGLEKSTLQNYLRLGKYFINDDFSLKGAIPQDTSVSLLNQILSFVKVEEGKEPDIRNVEALFTNGILTPYMKQAIYKKVISTLSKVKTTKELHEMDEEEVKAFKADLESLLKGKQEDKKQEDKKQEEAKMSDMDNVQMAIGRAMSILMELQNGLHMLDLNEEEMKEVKADIDGLYVIIGRKLD